MYVQKDSWLSELRLRVLDWPQANQRAGFALPPMPEHLSGMIHAADGVLFSDEAELRSFLEEHAFPLVTLRWTEQGRNDQPTLRFWGLDLSTEQRVYISDGNALVSRRQGLHLLGSTTHRGSNKDTLFLERLFKTNGLGFGLVLLDEVPSDVETCLESWGEIVRLFVRGFDAADFWEKLMEAYPNVWNPAYENPQRSSGRLARRLDAENTARLRADNSKLSPLDSSLLIYTQSTAKAGEHVWADFEPRHWNEPQNKERISARYLVQVLDY